MTATIERHAPVIVDVVLHDAKTGKAETLTCTPEHPLFVAGQGWVEAGSVGIGTSIVSRAGPAMQVTGLTWQKNKAQELASGTGSSLGGYTVYNLTVDGDHTFFVGTTGGGTWVHNSCDLAAEAKKAVTVIEQDANTYHMSIAVPEGTVEVMAELEADGSTLTLNGAHIYGPGGEPLEKGALGRAGLNNIARALADEFNASTLVVNGGRRATGPNAGKLPKPVIFSFDK